MSTREKIKTKLGNNALKYRTKHPDKMLRVMFWPRKFMEAFNLINTAFEHIFEILFPGGSGTLKLSDKNDVLNSNVDVICRLPGKKLTTLELFSGGEKSMISLALLFSILEVKPPAFCLLDEVEAALDEANVKRFTRMLRNFADKTQFLIITHKKKTMEYANTGRPVEIEHI